MSIVGFRTGQVIKVGTAKQTSFQDVTTFHGHVCPGTVIGYRAAKIATLELSSDRSVDEELVAIVENDSCSVDAVQVVTSCTFGKGNLVFRDYGKHVYTFINRDTGDAVRIALKSSVDLEHIDPAWSQLCEKVSSGPASQQEEQEFRKRADRIAGTLMKMPEEDLFDVTHIEIADVPKKARIFGRERVTSAESWFQNTECGWKTAKRYAFPAQRDKVKNYRSVEAPTHYIRITRKELKNRNRRRDFS